ARPAPLASGAGGAPGRRPRGLLGAPRVSPPDPLEDSRRAPLVHPGGLAVGGAAPPGQRRVDARAAGAHRPPDRLRPDGAGGVRAVLRLLRHVSPRQPAVELRTAAL